MIYNTIIFMGDSLTHGSRDEFGLSYPVELQRIFPIPLAAINLGIPGETTADMLRRCYMEINDYPDAKEVVFLAGTNDAKAGIDSDMFISNYKLLIQDMKILGKRVYVCTIPYKIGFGSPGYTKEINDLIVEYNKKIRLLMLPTIELESLKDIHLIDSIHFNHEGNIEVAKRVLNKIQETR